MAAAQEVVLEKNGAQHIVRDVKSGRSFKLKGYGALKGQIVFRGDIDLTEPIAAQARKSETRRKEAPRKAPKAVA
jgi:hypothetical protein